MDVMTEPDVGGERGVVVVCRVLCRGMRGSWKGDGKEPCGLRELT